MTPARSRAIPAAVLFFFVLVTPLPLAAGQTPPPPATTRVNGTSTPNPSVSPPQPTTPPNVTNTTPRTFLNLGSSTTWIVIGAVGIFFPLIGAACYVTLIWQQTALRNYKMKFEDILKSDIMHRRILEDEVKARDEERLARGEYVGPTVMSDGELRAAVLGANRGGRGAPDAPAAAAAPPATAVLLPSNPLPPAGPGGTTEALLFVPRPTMTREPVSTACKGPLFVRSSVPTADHAALFTQLEREEKERAHEVEVGEGASAMHRGLHHALSVHASLARLKTSSQLRNLTGLV